MSWNAWPDSEVAEAVQSLAALLQRAGAREVWLFGSALRRGHPRNDIDIAVRCDNADAIEVVLRESETPVYRISRDTYGPGRVIGSRPANFFDITVLTSPAATSRFLGYHEATKARLIRIDAQAA